MIRRRSLSMLGIEGNEDMVITTFIVPENADRSLWLNEQGIKLVKGINLIVSEKLLYNPVNIAGTQGAVSLIALFWDGIAGKATISANTQVNKSHIRGIQIPQSAYSLYASLTQLNAGNTKEVTVSEDGTLSCTTSATDVTTGNYNNSFMEGGCTYYLVQIPNDIVC